MAEDGLASIKRDPIKSSVGQAAAQRRRKNAVSIAKERREALVRTKRLCRVGISSVDDNVETDSDMMLDEEQAILDAQTSTAVEELKFSIVYQGKGATQKRVSALRELRHLLSKSELPLLRLHLKLEQFHFLYNASHLALLMNSCLSQLGVLQTSLQENQKKTNLCC